MPVPRITVDGRMAADPELRFGQSGKAVSRLRLVAADRRKDERSGEWVDGDTLWIDVTCFGQLAENVAESVTKGDLVVVTGKLKTEEWNDRDSGQKRSKIVLLADTVAASLQFRMIPHGTSNKGGPRGPVRPEMPVSQAYGADPSEPPF